MAVPVKKNDKDLAHYVRYNRSRVMKAGGVLLLFLTSAITIATFAKVYNKKRFLTEAERIQQMGLRSSRSYADEIKVAPSKTVTRYGESATVDIERKHD